MAAGVAYHRDYRVDGGAALFAAFICLSRRRESRLRAIGYAENHGVPAADIHHASGAGGELAVRLADAVGQSGYAEWRGVAACQAPFCGVADRLSSCADGVDKEIRQ